MIIFACPTRPIRKTDSGTTYSDYFNLIKLIFNPDLSLFNLGFLQYLQLNRILNAGLLYFNLPA